MKIFLAASYSTQVDYDTGRVNDEYKKWVLAQIELLESAGHSVFSGIHHDNYKINDADPAAAFRLDTDEIKKADTILAYVDGHPSAGTQTEIGYALAFNKKVFIIRGHGTELAFFNQAIILAGQATELVGSLADNIDELNANL